MRTHITSRRRSAWAGRVAPAVALALLAAMALGTPVAHALLLGPQPDLAAASTAALGYDAVNDTGSLSSIERIVGAQSLWASGYTGQGVGVALIDTGVTPVTGLGSPGQVVNGPDLSFDSQSTSLVHLDSFGHGTHMAGIIAGRDPGATADGRRCGTCLNSSGYSDVTKFVGVAPDSHIVNVKVGATDGGVDVSQVIAAIDWVVQHKDDPGMNIKVLSLSYGTNSLQPSAADPLVHAAEAAWRAGIFVVASAGNDGLSVPNLADPAYSPTLLAVGSSDPMGTQVRLDDTIPPFATHGTVLRPVDVIAPGTHVLSLRVPGSFIDRYAGGTVVGDRFLRGSGTSQSAAVVSGVVALLESRFPGITPGQVKLLLMNGAYRINANVLFTGRGIVDASVSATLGVTGLAALLPAPASVAATNGTLEASRGDSHVVSRGIALTGERDIFGHAFDVAQMRQLQDARTAWNGGTWNGTVWAASKWSGGEWAAITWKSNDWAGSHWRDTSWANASWDGSHWRDDDWAGSHWRDDDWAGSHWRDGDWSDSLWSASSWS